MDRACRRGAHFDQSLFHLDDDHADHPRGVFRPVEQFGHVGGNDIARAFDALARAFATTRRAAQGDAEVRGRLHRIASEHKAWDRLADLYEGLAEQAETAAAQTGPELR